MSVIKSRVLSPLVSLTPAGIGDTIEGAIEHFPGSRNLAVFDQEGMAPVSLVVPRDEAPERTDALAEDEVLLRNWTELRGIPETLVAEGLIELTGERVAVGPFLLEGLVARVL